MATSPDTFSHAHIALTAATTGALAAAVAAWRLPARRVIESAAVGALVGLAVYLWRASANLPQLNKDGISGYSANDWLAPVVTYVVLSVYADLRPPQDPAGTDRSGPPPPSSPSPSTSSRSEPLQSPPRRRPRRQASLLS